MPKLQKSVVSLRIMGDQLRPDEISALLGASPTHAHVKGQAGQGIVGPKVDGVRVAKSGMWTLKAPDREPENIDAQVQEILGQMTSDLAVWHRITSEYRVDLFCGVWLSGWDNGMVLSPKSLADLGERRIEFGLCIYYTGEGKNETSA